MSRRGQRLSGGVANKLGAALAPLPPGSAISGAAEPSCRVSVTHLQVLGDVQQLQVAQLGLGVLLPQLRAANLPPASWQPPHPRQRSALLEHGPTNTKGPYHTTSPRGVGLGLRAPAAHALGEVAAGGERLEVLQVAQLLAARLLRGRISAQRMASGLRRSAPSTRAFRLNAPCVSRLASGTAISGKQI